ncbi:MAG: 3-carboxy-cis,cis-muconate cycloisomerase [Proteobacteria bacterium]|nr:3-carboxy-cis,cis-muconate cycloisomerase [Pseudomonadota bacterium]
MILDAYLQDLETEALISDAALATAMLEVEAALARVQARAGIIPAQAGSRIAEAAAGLAVDLPALTQGTIHDGVPVIALLAQLRAAAGSAYGGYVHWGATSQDIVDTAMVLMLRRVMALFAGRLDDLIRSWAALAARHRGTVMAARTRSQQAVPTTFGLKAAGWLAPLLRHRLRLQALPATSFALQFGGAGGTLAALDGQGHAVARDLAAELDLALPPMPWHNQRDGIIEFANWLAMLSGSLGKTAGDVLLLAQSEIGELQISGAGGSSAMPQKANPVLAEALIALARHNAGLIGVLHQAAPHLAERDGAAWTLEWLTLPQMVRTTGAALQHSLWLAAHLQVNDRRMGDNVAAANGMLLAEAAVYALAGHMPKAAAQGLVKDACLDAITAAGDLIGVLQQRTEAPIDWLALRDPANYLGATEQFIDAVLGAVPPELAG